MDKAQRHISYHQMLDACALSGCPVCRLGRESAKRHIRAVIYDGVNDIPIRARLRNSLGYCREHAWQLPGAGGSAPLGIAIIHRDLLNTLSKRLEKAQFEKGIGSRLRGLLGSKGQKAQEQVAERRNGNLQPNEPCPACASAEVIEKLTIEATMEVLAEGDERLIESLRASDGLCLPHLRWALSSARDQNGFDRLVEISLDQLSKLIGDLDEFVRKHDHRYRNEAITAEERMSWQLALQRMVGPVSDSSTNQNLE